MKKISLIRLFIIIFIVFILYLFIELFFIKINKENFTQYKNIIEREPNPEPKTVFISFGGGSDNFRQRVYELCEKVDQLNFFTKTIPYTDYDLMNDSDFWSKHGNFFIENRRGYGYWLWKPYIILKTLENLNDGDFLVYVDSGCDINPKGMNRLKEYLEMVKTNEFGLLTFQLTEKSNKEINYSKRALLEHIGTVEEDKYTPQMVGGILIMKKTPHVINHVENLLNIGSAHNYNFINDSISENENPNFLGHRHDQSIHSLLIKSILRDNTKKAKPIVIPDETYFDPNWETDGILYPIWARRIK